eukprot:1925605-Pleurochrysis_carterae.AAC.1
MRARLSKSDAKSCLHYDAVVADESICRGSVVVCIACEGHLSTLAISIIAFVPLTFMCDVR